MRVKEQLGALCLAVGCGAPISLDESAGSEPTTSGTDPLGSTSSSEGPNDQDGPESGFDDDSGSAKLDLSARFDLPNPLPPGACPPDCQFELSLGWSYDGPAGAPLEPEDRLLLAVEDAGTVAIAEERQGSIGLARLDQFGQELWTMPLSLPCDPCRLVGLEMHPANGALVSGYGTDGGGSTIAFVTWVDLAGPSVLWTNTTSLADGPGTTPRAGPLVRLDEPWVAQPVLERSVADGLEHVELLVYDAGSGELAFSNVVATGPETGDTIVPLAARSGADVIAVSHPAWEDRTQGSELSWVHFAGDDVVATVPLTEPTVALTAASPDRSLTLGYSSSGSSVTLHLHSGTATEPEQWTAVRPHATDSAPMPALAADPQGNAYVAMRIATGLPGRETDTSIQLMRWSETGELTWQVALPVQTDHVDHPLSLSVTNAEGLLLGGYVMGVRHVEQRAANCICD